MTVFNNQNVVQGLLLIFTVSVINCIYFLCFSLCVLLLRYVNWNLYEHMDMDIWIWRNYMHLCLFDMKSNKWSKNFEERPHRHLVTYPRGEWIRPNLTHHYNT